MHLRIKRMIKEIFDEKLSPSLRTFLLANGFFENLFPQQKKGRNYVMDYGTS